MNNNNKIIVAIVILVIVGLGTYFLVFRNSSEQNGKSDTTNNTNYPATVDTIGTTQTTPPQTITPPATTAPVDVAVNIKGFAFSPSTVIIKEGAKVTWTNNDSVSHTVTSDLGKLLDSPTLAPGASFSFTFTKPGAVSYHCTLHPSMKGTIVIESLTPLEK